MDPQKTIRIVVFTGKDEDWNRWSKTFLAMVTAKGMREVIKPTVQEIVQDEDQNNKVYSDLLLSCQQDLIFGIVEEASSTDFLLRSPLNDKTSNIKITDYFKK